MHSNRLWAYLLVIAGSLYGCGSTDLTASDGAVDGSADGLTPVEADTSAQDSGQEENCTTESLLQDDRGDLSSTGVVDVTLPACTVHRYEMVVPLEQQWSLRLVNQGPSVLLGAIGYPDSSGFDDALTLFQANPESQTEVTFRSPRSGEFFLRIKTTDSGAFSRYDLNVTCSENCDRECSRYPLVLVHGFAGDPKKDFYKVPQHLGSLGYLVFFPKQNPINTSEVRGVELAGHLDGILKDAHSRKLNLIAHSQGGLDSRFAISSLGYGDRIASLITIATLHAGTPLADIALGLAPGPVEDALGFLFDLIGVGQGYETDGKAALYGISEEHIQKTFNPQNPNDGRVYYASWNGVTCPFGIGCQDACIAPLLFSNELLNVFSGPNDGLVPFSSAVWGEFRGTLPADHWDLVGQPVGFSSPNFDYLGFYLDRARELAARGF